MAGAAIGAAIGAGATSALESGLGAYFANRESNQAWDRTKAIYERRYQWTMNDMRKAGLNPILAYQQGASGGAAVPQTSQPQVKGQNYVSTAKEAALLGAQLRNVEASSAKMEAEAAGIASQNEQREFYGKLWSKANDVLDGLIKRFGPVIEKYAPEVPADLERPQNEINSGKSAGVFQEKRDGRWVDLGGYGPPERVKGGTRQTWRGPRLED